MTVQLRDSNGNLKIEIENKMFQVMVDKGILALTTKSKKNYTNGAVKTAFTFDDDLVFVSPIGRIYLWKNDFITIEH